MTGVLNRFYIWIEGDTHRLDLTTRPRSVGADAFESLRSRLIQQARDRLASADGRSRPLVGEGWTLFRDALECRSGLTNVTRIRREELAMIRVSNHELHLWTDGLYPTLRVPLASRNAFLLAEVLGAEIESRPTKPHADRLGRVLYERRRNPWIPRGLAVGAFAPVGLGVLVFSAPGKDGPEAAAMFFMLGIVMWIVAACLLNAPVFSRHERGVSLRSRSTDKSLAFADIETLCTMITQVDYHGGYVHTQYRLEFEPREGSGLQPIRQTVLAREPDPEFAELIDVATREVRERMSKRWRAGERVPWTRTFAFLPHALEFRPAEASAETHEVPFETIQTLKVHDGTFYLFLVGDDRPFATEWVCTPNFVPGLGLLEHILTSQPREEPETGTSPHGGNGAPH
jgi:hypothetical protein